ncbi:hypothetical protein IAT40_007676 [Kwoniella sp. CBS 6097]
MQLVYIVGMGPKDASQILSGHVENSGGQVRGHDHFEADDRAEPSRSNAAGPANNTNLQPLFAWDQLFSPLPSRQSSPQSVFAGLYN